MRPTLGKPSLLAALLLGSGILSGCVGAGDDAPVGATTVAGHTLLVSVTDVAIRAIPGAVVAVEGTGPAISGPDGTARLTGVPPGTHRVVAGAEGYVPRAMDVVVPADADGPVHASVVLLASTAPPRRVDAYEFEGFFDCTATAIVITGDCLTAVRAVDPAGVSDALNASQGRSVFAFPVPDDWTRIEIVLRWGKSALATSDGLRFNVEADEGSTEMHAVRFGVASGPSPLPLTLERGFAHPTADVTDAGPATVPTDIGTLRLRVFQNGLGHNPGAPPFLGVGAGVEQRFTFTVHVTAGGPDA